MRTGSFALAAVVFATPWVAAAVTPQEAAAQAHEVELPELHLSLTLPPMEGLRETLQASGLQRGRWGGTSGHFQLEISLLCLELPFSEPGDVTELVVDNLREQSDFVVSRQSFFQGKYGLASFASLVEADLRAEGRTDAVGAQYLLGCLLEKGGYVVLVECRPRPDEALHARLLEFLEKGISYAGKQRDPGWSLEEIQERWRRDVPEELHADFLKALEKKSTLKDAVLRTDNYIILTSSSGGKSFAKQMEENHAEIAKLFPFADVDGQRLMPVFLFRTPDEYYAFYVKVAGVTLEAAKRSKGHAWKDYYATWYEAPGDPVHIHEATHQIFKNRLRLSGGGSWFQEGVAEYVESSKNERNEVANLVKRGRHTALREFFALKSLLYSSEEERKTGGSEAGDHYKQAALLIEFLREGPLGEELFTDFLLSVGKAPRNDLPKIEELVRRVYGLSLEELDAQFQEYCKER